MKPALKFIPKTQFTAWLREKNCPIYRQNQINNWLYREYAIDFDEMSNLPRNLREKLSASFSCFSLNCRQRLKSEDGTIKYLFELSDGETVETVLIPSGKRRTVCISTQAGCPVGCAFCATGRSGWKRDLEPAEIFDQIIFVCRELGERVTNVVVMGMGEPLLNYQNTLAALDLASFSQGLDISARHITISTSGIPARIRQLAEHGLQWNLSWSLHAADPDTRARLIPSPHRHSIRETSHACQYYREKTGRKITLEYALLAGINDSRNDAEKLVRLAERLDAKINLIACNPGSGGFKAPKKAIIHQFKQILHAKGANVTLRQSRGDDIQAACGQLRGEQGKV